MQLFRKIIFYFVIVISTLVILASLLSLIYDVSFWFTKVLDFPRLQFLIVGLLCFLTFLFVNKKWKFPSIFLNIGLLASIILQAGYILPYYFGEKKVPDSTPVAVNEENTVGIMIANVLITNNSADTFLNIVNQRDPDLLLVMEVNSWWISQLEPLERKYSRVIKYPLDNAYGMALYSKLPLYESEVMFLKHKDVPSIHAKIALVSGRVFMFHGVHPVAPVPSGKYPDNEGEEEVALLKVGKMVVKNPLPAIVAGDFNDVSWSNTSRLFSTNGKLNNVRLGRGLYNSFNAESIFMRWPLDHYFVSQEFALVKLARMQKFGSDHFPMYAKFVLR